MSIRYQADEMPRFVAIRLTPRQVELVMSALDSHIYWQLSDEQYRHSGFVLGSGSDDPAARKEIRATERLLARLERERVTRAHSSADPSTP